MLSLSMQNSSKYFRYGAQDSFSSKIRPNILMVSLMVVLYQNHSDTVQGEFEFDSFNE